VSTTPRTDAFAAFRRTVSEWVEFAGGLERELAATGWRDIADAPKDGTEVQGWNENGWVPRMRFHQGNGWNYQRVISWMKLDKEPSHFRAIPTSPKP